MAGQPRYVDFYDPLQRKFVKELSDESFKRCPSTGSGIAIDRPEVPDIQHETAGRQCCDESEKTRDRYRACGKICERRHLQEKERRSSVRSKTLPIHRLLHHNNIVGHHFSAQRRI